ncbi:4-(cytidine 5'-diphospho)-2-C-methyl-D-erythritol kinase [Orbaceae bacterium ac157xtp]
MLKQWISPAKLNLFLYITGRRANGYHDLQTLFQFVDINDYLTFTPRADNQINLITPFAEVEPNNNLIIRAAKLLLQYKELQHNNSKQPYGVDIAIKKNIPMGGGLGGGSSNAGTTLIALNQLWDLQLSQTQLAQLGIQLGADVPIFIFGHSAFAEGIGEKLQTVTIPEHWYLIVKPEVNIATADIFNHPNLTRNSPIETLQTRLNSPYHNDCEPVVRSLYPVIDKIISFLQPFAETRLTGTGASIFSVCDTEQQTEKLQQKLNEALAKQIKFSSFVTKGTNTSPLQLLTTQDFTNKG